MGRRQYEKPATYDVTVSDGVRVSAHGRLSDIIPLAWGCCGNSPSYIEGAPMNTLGVEWNEPCSLMIKPIHDLGCKETFLDIGKLQEIIERAGEREQLSTDRSHAFAVQSALVDIIAYILQQDDHENAWTMLDTWMQTGINRIKKQQQEAKEKDNPEELLID